MKSPATEILEIVYDANDLSFILSLVICGSNVKLPVSHDHAMGIIQSFNDAKNYAIQKHFDEAQSKIYYVIEPAS